MKRFIRSLLVFAVVQGLFLLSTFRGNHSHLRQHSNDVEWTIGEQDKLDERGSKMSDLFHTDLDESVLLKRRGWPRQLIPRCCRCEGCDGCRNATDIPNSCCAFCASLPNEEADEIPEDIDSETVQAFIPPISEGRVLECYNADTISIAAYLPFEDELYKFAVRIDGILCPKLDAGSKSEQSCARIAKKAVELKILNKMVKLDDVAMDNDGRLLANVTADGLSVGDWLLEQGLAVPYDGENKEPPLDWLAYYNQTSANPTGRRQLETLQAPRQRQRPWWRPRLMDNSEAEDEADYDRTDKDDDSRAWISLVAGSGIAFAVLCFIEFATADEHCLAHGRGAALLSRLRDWFENLECVLRGREAILRWRYKSRWKT